MCPQSTGKEKFHKKNFKIEKFSQQIFKIRYNHNLKVRPTMAKDLYDYACCKRGLNVTCIVMKQGDFMKKLLMLELTLYVLV